MKITADDFRRIMHPKLRDPQTEERRKIMLARRASTRTSLSSTAETVEEESVPALPDTSCPKP